MVYDVSDKGIEDLNTVASAAAAAIEKIAQENQNMVAAAEECKDSVGPHQRELYEALWAIAQSLNEAAAPAGKVSEVLKKTAQRYEEIIARKRFGTAAGAVGAAAGAAAGAALGANAGGGSSAGGASAGASGQNGGSTGSGSAWTGAVQTEHKPLVDSYQEGVSAVQSDMQEGSGTTVSQRQAEAIYYGVHEYAGGKSSFVRGAYENPNASPKAREMMQNVDTYIHAAPKYQGTVHRGINVSSEVADIITSQETVDMLGPSSWSSDKEVAERFSHGYKDVRIVFTLPENHSGASITHIACFDEREVLAPSGVKYHIDRIDRGKDKWGDVIYIDVHEGNW